MKKLILLAVISTFAISGCQEIDSQTRRDSVAVERQQKQISKSQPVPAYNWSLERHLLSALYQIRNREVATHSVWRSDLGQILFDCPSMGYGLPYDTSLTNPYTTTDEDQKGTRTTGALAVIEQAEPNGIFASKNTSATWVMCVGEAGKIDPVYVETKVNVYPFPLKVNYETNRITKAGKSKVTINKK